MASTLEHMTKEGESWAARRLWEGQFMGSVQRHLPEGFPSSRLAAVVESITKSFGAAYALEHRFDELIDMDRRGMNKGAVVAYETANSIMGQVKPLANVRLTTDESGLEGSTDMTDHLLDGFMKGFCDVDLEGLIKGEQGIINYVAEHFNRVRNAAERMLPRYELKQDVFGNRISPPVGGESAVKDVMSVYRSEVDFDDYIGGDDLKRRVNRQVFQFVRDEKGWRRLVKNEGKARANVRLNLAFDGPPGSGKSYFCKAIAGELEAPFYMVKGADFIKKYMGEGKDRMEELYRQAASNGIGVIAIEEADVIGISRESEEAKHKRDVIETWLTLLHDGVGEGKVVTIINTNLLKDFDDAVLDRFPSYNRFRFEPMSKDMLGKVMRYHLGLYQHEDIPDQEFSDITSMMHGSSLRGIGDISYLASCYAMERGHELIVADDLRSAIDDYQGSIR